ncbi:PorP/SprF family type IX secretion system membrane protein [Draconibacterium halophilum]|uniref:Type IX secretion system membrane protein PorP/SprF n=1 Tax=Draconibacterium halophilum TaxID=2706887 RepID=A0A6C0R952_9BACT|nr:type IX secretion system membrane protein PorP/SprF [Draconibacterium halophilum]QIA06637.1 type IX secretion system membrane protein PorP/SprF [Draconibacterium halophilum]
MRKAVSFLFIIMSVTIVTHGQQDPQYTNNMFYKLGVNPGYAGAEDAINGILLNRYQWSGFEGAPKTLVFSVDAAINAFGSPGGIGVNVISDEWGFYKNTWVNLNYSYKVTTALGTLGLGISPGIFNFNISPEWDVPQGEMYTPAESDPSVPNEEASQITFDVGFGAYLYTNKYYAGFSATHINQGEVMYDDVAVDFLARHYYFTGGYNIKLSDPLFEVRPSFLLKSDLASWQIDLNANVVYNDKFWGGISYRVQDAVALLMGMELFNGMRIGYSFDLVTSAIKSNGFASNEFFVSYSIDLERNRNQKYKSIRFL